MGPAMEQCSEADMALDQRGLKYIITNAMKQTRPGRLTENSKVHWDEYLNSVQL